MLRSIADDNETEKNSVKTFIKLLKSKLIVFWNSVISMEKNGIGDFLVNDKMNCGTWTRRNNMQEANWNLVEET